MQKRAENPVEFRSAMSIRLFLRFELVFLSSAYRAYPVIGEVGESSSGIDTVVRISYGRIIHPSAYSTYIFFHKAVKKSNG